MKKIHIFILAIVMIVVLIVVSILKENNALDEAKEWATENGYVIRESDTHRTNIGTPFYYLNKGQLIVELDVIDRAGGYHKVWMRTGTFSNDFIQE